MPVRSCVYYVVNVGSEAPAYSLIQFRRKFVTRNYYPSWNEVNKVREMNGKSKVGNNITAAQQSWYYIRKGQRSISRHGLFQTSVASVAPNDTSAHLN